MNYPHGTEDLLKLLVPGQPEGDFHAEKGEKATTSQVAHDSAAPKVEMKHASEVAKLSALGETADLEVPAPPAKGKIIRTVLPYAAIFVVALCFYFLFFTNVSLTSLFNSTPKSAPQNVSKESYPNLDAYYTWIRSYYFQVTDESILDPSNDISGNGLTNYQKFVLGLNPKKVDTLGLGLSDTQNIIAGINPTTGAPYTEEQMKLIKEYVDLETASNKMTLNVARQNSQQIAGVNTYATSGRSGTSNINNPVSNNTNNSNYITNGNSVIDQNVKAQLDIPSIKLSVPVIWTQNVESFTNDLKQGVVHYPGTALPGEIGVGYISGHSSNYAWAKGFYNRVFDSLGKIKQYDSFSITVTDTNGKRVVYHYIVTGSQIFKADDQTQFASHGRSVIALSTCWPIGTSDKRLVVYADLSQIER